MMQTEPQTVDAKKAARKAYMAAYYLANREKENAKNAAWRAVNREKWAAYTAAWRVANPEKERAAVAAWRAANPEKNAAKQARYRSSQLRRTPPWADLDAVRFFYATSQYMTASTESRWHVDHIVPLRGKRVSGLHTHLNLQVIPAVNNLKKGNRHAE